MEVPCFHTVMLHQEDGEDICLTTTEGGMEMTGQDYMEVMDRKDNILSFQIFPDPIEVVECSDNCLVHVHDNAKERLPSIVVEPTDVHEVESGELRWPPENVVDLEDEDLFLEQCIPPANIADWGDEEDDEGTAVAQEHASVILNHQPSLTLIDLQSDAFRDDTPTLPPAPALN